jgi:hypothetical protein
MIQRFLILIFTIGALTSTDVSAQLSEGAIKEIAQNKTQKWSSFLQLSQNREDKLYNKIKLHEKNNRNIIESQTNFKADLNSEYDRFIKDLSTIFTPNELEFVEYFMKSSNADDKEYLGALLSSITTDTSFIQAFKDLQYKEVLPSMMVFRMELDEMLSESDKETLDSLRTDIYNMYDHCLLTCVANHAGKTDSLFEDINIDLLININKKIEDKSSSLSQAIAMTHKYEDDILAIFKSNNAKFDYWSKEITALKEQHVLPNHVENINKIKMKNDVRTLESIETEVIFLLIDSEDENLSRKFLNMGVHNYL